MNDHEKIELSIELERRILKGISMEWDSADSRLRYLCNHSMKKPRFSLMDSRRELGRWSREKREISLSRELVLNHPWDSVIEVLVHEMAHQFADEILHARDEMAHGPLFREACELLGAKPQASGDYQTLHERVKSGRMNEPDKIMVKIKKLLSLAGSQNRHEAETAMAKAHELIKKYNVDMGKKGRPKQFESIFLGRPKQRRFREDHHLTNLICDYYFVEGVWTPAYVLENEAMGRAIEISGDRTNLIIAEYVYHFISHYMESEWIKYTTDKKMSRRQKTDFCVGLIQGFKETLTQQNRSSKEKSAQTSWALSPVKERELLTYIQDRYPKIRQTRLTALKVDSEVMDDGHAVGRKMVIAHGVTEKKGNQGLLIERLQ